MTEYYIPTASAEAELVEKRSRFIGQVKPVETEEEARAFVEQVKKKHYDARHNCWCYRLRDGGVERYSDDGEPQGTAGQPMLNVFQREEVLDAAGISVVRRWVETAVPCPYSFFDRVRLEVEAHGGVLGETEYAADVTVHALLPEGQVEAFSARMTELTAGGTAVQILGEAFKAVPVAR